MVIPANVWRIDSDAFKGCNNLKVSVYPKSVALKYCQENDISYRVLVPQAVRSVLAEQKSIDAKDCAVATFTVKTSKKALSLKLCAESGAQVAEFTEKNAQVVASDDELTWTFDYAFVNDGKRELSLIAVTEDGKCEAWPITADMRGTRVKAASFPGAWAERGKAAQIRVTTNMGADTLRMYSEGGVLIRTWSAEGNSTVSGSDRIWSVTYAFANMGTRTMTFRALRNGVGGHTSASAQVKVELPVTVDSVSASTATVTAKETLKFTVKTSTNAKYVRMYSEGGYMVKSWAAEGNSTVSGNVRIWTLSYAFGNAGDRTLTFRASADGTHVSEGKSASVKVMTVPDVTSASASTATVTVGNTLTFTATTPTNSRYLTLYAEGGTKVKTWNCDGNSTVSGNVCMWKVEYTFGGTGDRRITLKASADGTNYGSGKELAVKVLPVMNVTSANASVATVTAQETMTFTVRTPAGASVLALFSEGGSFVKSWSSDGNSTVSGSVRTWKVQYAFGGTGDRRVTLKASADGVNFGKGVELAVKVLPLPGVQSAKFSGSTVKRGANVNVVVKTSSNSRYLHMFVEDGKLYRTWSSEGNSVISGGYRVWTVPLSFSAAGTRKITFRASADSAHYGSAMTATIKVK